MPVELRVPKIGESVSEVQVGNWLKNEGEAVEVDEEVVEIESEKATEYIYAPSSGVISSVLKKQGETAEIEEVIGYIDDTQAPDKAASQSKSEEKPKEKKKAAAADGQPTETSQPATTATAEPQEPIDDEKIMPAARRLLAEHNLKPEEVRASGPGGRLLKEDVLAHIEHVEHAQSIPPAPIETPETTALQLGRETERVPMSPMRQTIAKHLVNAQQTAALLTTFNEVNMAAVMDMRKKYKDAFQEHYNVKLGFMSFFVKAVVEALKAIPQVNAQIEGKEIVYYRYYDIGIAVGGGKGLVVPIIRNAERLSFAEIEMTINDFATRAKNNKISRDELSGGTFTISNGGVYGSLLSTPIINPPQSGILGLHSIQERPVAENGQVVIRPMMYLALTYDHRIVDGREAVTFLKHIKNTIEDPSRMLLEL